MQLNFMYGSLQGFSYRPWKKSVNHYNPFLKHSLQLIWLNTRKVAHGNQGVGIRPGPLWIRPCIITEYTEVCLRIFQFHGRNSCHCIKWELAVHWGYGNENRGGRYEVNTPGSIHEWSWNHLDCSSTKFTACQLNNTRWNHTICSFMIRAMSSPQQVVADQVSESEIFLF